MSYNNKTILCGVSLDSYNRGVNALAIGSIDFIRREYNIDDILIVNIGKQQTKTHEVIINDKPLIVTSKSFATKRFVFACICAINYRLFRIKPKDKLAQIIRNCNSAFNLNEGDSFSDLYGKYRFFAHFFVSLSFILWKKPLSFLPQTIGPFNKLYGRFLSRYILRKLKKLFIRDTAANDFLTKIGITGEQRIDVASLMQPKEVKDFNINKDSIGLNINGLMYFDSYGISDYQNNYQNWLKMIVDLFLSKNFQIVLIPHTYDVDVKFPENDFDAIKDFIDSYDYGSNDKVSSIGKNYDAQEIKFLISNVQIFIGSRMHSCIAALSSGIPCIGIAYSYKFKGTFAKFNQEKYVMDIKSGEMDDLKNLISDNIFNRERIAAELRLLKENSFNSSL